MSFLNPKYHIYPESLPHRMSSKHPKKKRRTNNQELSKPSKSSVSEFQKVPSTSLDEIGGSAKILYNFQRYLELPLNNGEAYLRLGTLPFQGILLHGPPGCGKTFVVNAFASFLNIPFLSVSGPEIVDPLSGEAEKKLRTLFQDAVNCAPSLIFLDDIDTIAGKRGSSTKEMTGRIVAQLCSCFDSLNSHQKSQRQAGHNHPVFVIAATSRLESIDSSLRRAGRFSKEILIEIPDKADRIDILKKLTTAQRLDNSVNLERVASQTPGYVGADLHLLCQEAGNFAIERLLKSQPLKPMVIDDAEISPAVSPNSTTETQPMTSSSTPDQLSQPLSTVILPTISNPPLLPKQMESFFITQEDYEKALGVVQPSARREGFSTIPDVSWSSVGGLDKLKSELQFAIVEPIRNPEGFQLLGIGNPVGVLLYGPPGCGKTLVARAVANASGANFISVKGPELLNKYVGESERSIRALFERAGASSPCIIFFDELDALAPRRSSDSSSSQASERVVNQLLTELDGMEPRKQVYVIAATNRIDIIDEALLRPGRFDKKIHVPLPDGQCRFKIFQTITKNVPISKGVNLADIAKKSQNFSGADCTALVREAATCLYKELLENSFATREIRNNHFDQAFKSVKPSVHQSYKSTLQLSSNYMA